MYRDFEKDMIELDAAIKSNAERDNTFTLSVLQRAKLLIMQQKEKLKAYEDTGLEPEDIINGKKYKEKLRPCPFCGRKDLDDAIVAGTPEEYFVGCPTCNFGFIRPSRDAVVKKWNRRK